MLKFIKNGQLKAVLKDEMSEPEGFKYKDGELLDDFVLPEGVQSLEEMEALLDQSSEPSEGEE